MRIAAASDVHGDEFLEPFRRDLAKLPSVDLFLLAGDLTDHNHAEDFTKVVGLVTSRIAAEVVGVFGNNEYPESQDALLASCQARFLREEARAVRAGSETLRVVGTLGSLDEPTWWQRQNLPDIARQYAQRVDAVDRLLQDPQPTLLLTHYPPTHATMGREKEAWRPQLGSLRLEAVVRRRRPVAVVHGHVHKGVPYGEIGGQATLEDFGGGPIPVFNVALPVTGGITLLEYRDGLVRPLRG
jgi:Icc-related predicted phosphoesterase